MDCVTANPTHLARFDVVGDLRGLEDLLAAPFVDARGAAAMAPEVGNYVDADVSVAPRDLKFGGTRLLDFGGDELIDFYFQSKPGIIGAWGGLSSPET